MTTTPNTATADARTPDETAAWLDAQIVETEKQIRDNDAAVEAIADRIRSGEVVDPQEIPRQRSVADHARLFLEGLRKRKDDAVRDARLLRLSAVREDIEAQAATDEDEVNDAILAAAESLVALTRLLQARAERMHRNRGTLVRERVPGVGGPSPEPSPTHGGLATARGDLVAGRLRLAAIDPDTADTRVKTVVDALMAGQDAPRVRTVHTTSDPSEDLTYWTHAGHGGVLSFGQDGPPAHALKVDPDLGVPSLRQITYWEAVQIGWRDADERGPELMTR